MERDKKQARILVIDDEKGIVFTVKAFLLKEGYEVSTANNYDEVLDILAKEDFDLIFTDIMLGDETGIDVLREAKRRNLTCPVILNTGYPDIETKSEAMRLGAYDYLHKPVTKETLLRITDMALHQANPV